MTPAPVVKMANHIAANVPDRLQVATQTAEHIDRFWTRAMIEDLLKHAAHDANELLPEVQAAVEVLRQGTGDPHAARPAGAG